MYDGNSFAWSMDKQREEQKRYCPHCDCKHGHRCLVCESELSKKECEENDGHCDKHKGKENGTI